MHTVIKRRTGLANLNLRELWESASSSDSRVARRRRSLQQTYIGAGWAFIRPFLTMVVFTVVFGKIAKLPSDGVPYPILTFTALLPWQFFATAFAETASSIVGNGYMITKIYFPRLILPLTSTAVAFVDFLVSLFFLVALMAYYRVTPSPRVFALPLFTLLLIAFTIGLGLWFAAMYVRFRDLRHLIRSSRSSGCTSRPLRSAARSCRRSGGCSIRSIRWSRSSTDSAGRSSARCRCTCRP
jgi:hypothetical protein